MRSEKKIMSDLVPSHSKGEDAVNKDQGWKAGWSAPTAHSYPRTTGCGSTGDTQIAWSSRKPSLLLLNVSSYSERLVAMISCFHQLRMHIFQILPVKPAHLYFSLWCKGSVLLRDIFKEGRAAIWHMKESNAVRIRDSRVQCIERAKGT